MAASRSLLLFLFICLSSSSLFTLVVGDRGMVGGWTLVKNVKTNKQVQELGRFSVLEYNRLQHPHQPQPQPLTFSEVIRAETQVVSGIKYHLKVAAQTNGLLKTFDAVVVVQPWLHSRQLLTFTPSTN